MQEKVGRMGRLMLFFAIEFPFRIVLCGIARMTSILWSFCPLIALKAITSLHFIELDIAIRVTDDQ
jgi:hypothetical protein